MSKTSGVSISKSVISLPMSMIKVKDRARVDVGDLESMMESIKEKGLIQPITVDKEFNLIAGRRRMLAHEGLGLDHIDAIIRTVTGEIDAKEVELIENIARKDMTWQEITKAESELFKLKGKWNKWSVREQAKQLEDTKSSVGRYIKMAEAIEMIPELGSYKTFDEAWKDYKKLEEGLVVQALSEKGRHKFEDAAKWATDHYHVGDAFIGMSSLRSDLVHFAEIDPPYAVDLVTRKSRNKLSNMDEYNEVDPDEYVHFYEKTSKEVFRILKDNCFAVFWFGWDWYDEVRDAIQGAGFKIPTIPTIWTKGNSGQVASPDTTFASCHEPFWLARKGKPKLARPGRGNVFDFSPVSAARKIHPTERPLELMKEILGTICFPGSSILVPFLGSGSTLRAAYQCGHTGFGYDLSPENKRRFLRRVAEDKGDVVETEEVADATVG